MTLSIALRTAPALAPLAGTTTTDRMTPRAEGISSKRHDNPERSGTVSAWRRRDGEFAALDRGFRPAETTAGEHRVRHIRRRREARHANVKTLRADVGDRHHRHAHDEAEIVAHPGGGRGHRLARQRKIAGRHGEACAVTAEHERKFAMIEGVGDGGDDRSTGHVHGLVLLCRDRRRRLHDVGDADGPVVRQRNIQRRVHQPAKAAEQRHAGVEGILSYGDVHRGILSDLVSDIRQLRAAFGDGFLG